MHSNESEMTVLGSMLFDEQAVFEATNALEVGDFYVDSHRTIFSTIRSMKAQGMSADTLSVGDELKRRKLLDTIGGPAYLHGLCDGIPRGFSIKGHVAIIRRESQRRRVVALCELMTDRARQGEDPSDLLNDLHSTALEHQAAGVSIKPTPIHELIVPFWEAMRHQRNFAAGDVLGIPTGIAALDRETTGWRDGELTYVGALPGRGKTSFLLQGMYAAARAGFGAGCISLEMRSGQLLQRLTNLASGLDAQRLRDVRTMNASEFQTAKDALFGLGELPISICDQSGLKPSQIAAVARQMHAAGARVIFIDFVQVIHEDGKDRREAINRVSAALRDTCKSLNIPFVVASQLARRDADPNRRPTIQDLRESGNLEQDAHNVMLLYRPKDKATGDWTGEDEIIIDKQREGATGMVPVRYDDRSLTYVAR